MPFDCSICAADKFLCNIKEEITKTQFELKKLWENDVVGTILPSFKEFDKVWVSSFRPNPLYCDWTRFDIHNDWDIDYLVFVQQVMEEQIIIWSTDDLTSKHEVYKQIEWFLEGISTLNTYVNKH